MIAKRKPTKVIGDQFEKQVETLLELFGYSVERNVLVNGNQIDLRAMVDLPTHQDTMLVECKAHKAVIGIEQLRSFYSIIADSPNDIRGLYITSSGFTAEAKTFASGKPRLTISTYRELERKVIDPALYFKARIDKYPTTEVYNTFVDLRCKDNIGSIKDSVEESIISDINNPEVTFLALLGEYGSGKSTILDHLEYRLAKNYLKTVGGKIPIRINLGEYTKSLNIRQLITDILVHRFNIRNPRYDIFEELNKQGRLVILFDGFDEMSTKVDDIVVRENYSEIRRLCVGSSKIILTCRTSFFRNRSEELQLLGIKKDRLRESIEGTRGIQSTIYYLLPFTWEQIERVISKSESHRKRLGKKRLDSKTLVKNIHETYNLEELAQRPFLLNMILQSVPYIKTSLRTLTAGILYDIYTDEWVRRDAAKGRILETPERRLFFAKEIAYEMYSKSFTYLHWRRIPEWIDRHLGIKDKLKDYYDYDVRTSNFLTRNEAGNYYFAHRSFMEFFVARKLAEILYRDRDYRILSHFQINEEIRQFMVDLHGNLIADQLTPLLYLITLEADRLKLETTRNLVRNVLGLLKQLGTIRVIVPVLKYLMRGPQRPVRTYLLHFLSDSFSQESTSFTLEAQAMLTTISILTRGRSEGVDPSIMYKVWRNPPSLIKKEIHYAVRISRDPNILNKTLKRLVSTEKVSASITTSEIAYALATDEDVVINALKAL